MNDRPMTTAGLQAKVALRRAWFEAHPNAPLPEAREQVNRLIADVEDEAVRDSAIRIAALAASDPAPAPSEAHEWICANCFAVFPAPAPVAPEGRDDIEEYRHAMAKGGPTILAAPVAQDSPDRPAGHRAFTQAMASALADGVSLAGSADDVTAALWPYFAEDFGAQDSPDPLREAAQAVLDRAEAGFDRTWTVRDDDLVRLRAAIEGVSRDRPRQESLRGVPSAVDYMQDEDIER